LLREAHVTRAAQRIGLSQSAMSHALARLRQVMGDPLLVRTARGMTLTPRAQAVAERLASALGELDAVLGPPAAFEPKELEREIRIAAIDFAQLVLIPPLVAELAKRAPGVTLVVVPPVEPVERALADGSVDLAIGLRRDAPTLEQRELLVERFVCVVRRRRGAEGRLGLGPFSRRPHVLISPRGRVPGAVDAALRRRNRSRRVTLTVPHTLAAALVVAESDAVLTVAERVARIALRGLPVRIVEPPIALEPFRVSMLWHPRLDADPAHAFLRETLADVATRL
jgi:DNA-binding transcriptional LysR family regulator